MPEEEPATYDFPLRWDEIESLLPDIVIIARRYSKCPHERMDFVQNACVVLRTWERKGTKKSPRNKIHHCIRDYIKVLKKQRMGQFGDNEDDQQIEPVAPYKGDPLTYEELYRFEGLGLNEDEKRVAVCYWHREMSVQESALQAGVSVAVASKAVDHVIEEVRKRWIN